VNVGTIAQIRRYPVKSMGGETLDAAEISLCGLVGDRAYALFDPLDPRIVSASNVTGFPGLLDVRARYVDRVDAPGTLPPIEITFADGTAVRSDDPNASNALSGWFGRRVQLGALADDESRRPAAGKYSMPGTFFDYAPLHLLTDAAIGAVAKNAPSSRISVDRFRPNILVAVDSECGYPENEWTGRSLRIGDHVVVEVTDPCPRCAMATLAQGDLPRDAGVLKAIARRNMVHAPFTDGIQPCLGAYAFVARGGVVGVGDAIRWD
jgi:uncharacterized protein YcbX